MHIPPRVRTIITNALLFYAMTTALFGHIAGPLTIILLFILYVKQRVPVPTQDAHDILGGNKTHIIAHRGGVPENTLEAIRKAKKNGATAVEFDISFTKDNIPVLLHDDSVDRTTDGHGDVKDLLYSDVLKLDAASKSGVSHKYTTRLKIPTLDEAIQECLKLDLIMFLDCKTDAHKTAKLLHEMYEKYPVMYKKAIVCSFWPQIIFAVRQADRHIVTGLTHRPRLLATADHRGAPRSNEQWKQLIAPVLDVILDWCHYAWFWYLCGNSYFLAHEEIISRSYVSFWESLGIKVVVWTVNEKSSKVHVEHLHCSYMTDSVL